MLLARYLNSSLRREAFSNVITFFLYRSYKTDMNFIQFCSEPPLTCGPLNLEKELAQIYCDKIYKVPNCETADDKC